MTDTTPFIHLRNHSAYSMLEGAIKIPKLIDLSKKHQMPAVALTDRNNVFGAMEFALAAQSAGIQPIFGVTLHVVVAQLNEDQPRYSEFVLLAASETGYQNLIKLVSLAYQNPHPLLGACVSFEEMCTHNAGLICLTGGVKGALGQFLTLAKEGLPDHLAKLTTYFEGRLYLEIQRHELETEEALEEKFLKLAFDHHIPIVATNQPFYPTREFYKAHDTLLCIARGLVVTEEERQSPSEEHYFKSQTEMKELFSDLPEAVLNTAHIAQQCHFLLQGRAPILPSFSIFTGVPDAEELRNQVKEGLEARLEAHKDYIKDKQPYFDRMEEELEIIISTGFPGYFLIVADFIKWANEQGIAVGPGRGSGAGSLVAWALTITGLDPLRFGLLFERFLNPERVSLPDFDIDFCQDRRDEVIAYVRDKYGADKVAQIITFGKLQAKMVVRDVGRALGLPYGQVDGIAKLIPNNPANPVTLKEAIEGEPQLQEMQEDEPNVAELLEIGQQLEGLYRHASTHAAGVVIGDRPLTELVALYSDFASPLMATQFNMKYVEMTGLVKFDFLGLKTLSVIQHTVELLKTRGIEIDIPTIPLDDIATYEMLKQAETVGVFQVEGAGMRDVIKKISPDCFEELIAIVALYRPGPMDNIPKYIACKHGQEKVTYLHPKLEDILSESYGIMIYQEQVMQAAQLLAGYSLGAADLLRRAMGKKVKEEMDAQRKIFTEGATKHGIDQKKASEIFDQMAKFAGYGFNKSHAAGYALMLYQTAYLKANYPEAFLAASMTYELTNTDKLRIFVEDVKRVGIPLLPPDINKSETQFSLEENDEGVLCIRYALGALKNVGQAILDQIIAERRQNGAYKSLEDYLKRVDPKCLNKGQFTNLIASGAFDRLHENRAQLTESLEALVGYAQTQKKSKAKGMRSFFEDDHELTALKLAPQREWRETEKVAREFAAFGFYFSSHPLDSYTGQLDKITSLTSADLQGTFPEGRHRMAAVIMDFKERISKQGKRYGFLTFSDHRGVFESVVFSEGIAEYRQYFDKSPPVPLIITVQVKIDKEAEGLEEGGRRVRMSLLDMKPLSSEVIQNEKQLHLIVKSPEDLAHIKEVMAKAAPGHVQIALSVMYEGQVTRMKLGRRLNFSAQQLDELERLMA